MHTASMSSTVGPCACVFCNGKSHVRVQTVIVNYCITPASHLLMLSIDDINIELMVASIDIGISEGTYGVLCDIKLT